MRTEGNRGGCIKDATKQRDGANGNDPVRPRPRIRYWLIVRKAAFGGEVLVTGPQNEKSLPVFSFPEEAEMFLRLELSGDEWRVREATPGECLSLLSGPCAGVTNVALDPLPDMVASEMLGLVNVSRREFVKRLLNSSSLSGV